MRRLAHLVAVAVLGAVALAGFAGVGGAIADEPLRASQGLDDFTFDSWHSEFQLGLTPEGRSTLTTIETIVARFPYFDQNRGLRRAIPNHYDGHQTDVTIESVTDENGAPRSYETESTGGNGSGFLEVTIAGDDFVHGAQSYVITYSQINVALYPDDASNEEFYWEVNGTGWLQPFGEVSATLLLDAELTAKLNGQTTCYRGFSNSAQICDVLTSEADGDGWRVDVSASNLGPYEGLTMVVGFEEGTFEPRDDSFTANPFPSIGLGATLLGVIIMILSLVARATRWRSARGRPTIIAEYLPPKGVNLLQAGNISGAAGKSMAAQFLSFAVRGNVRVLEVEGTKHFKIELVHADGLDLVELGVISTLFPGLQSGMRRDLKAKNMVFSRALGMQLQASRERVFAEGLRERKDVTLRVWLIVASIASAVLSFVAGIIAVETEVGGTLPESVALIGIVAAVLTFVFTVNVRPFTAAGAELRDYLKGVRLYIRLAEADRLRVLQSPQGALRSPYRPDPTTEAAEVGYPPTGEPLQVLKLYERLLPFAVLFGQEKAWSRVLGEYYAQSGSQPDWYAGSGAFNAGFFAAGISSFSTTTSTSWSGSSSSSSSSGSSGGGSVGGGGGGGGGGGV